MRALRSFAIASAAPGVGTDPIKSVPEMSMRSAWMGGDLKTIEDDLLMEVKSLVFRDRDTDF